MSRTPPPFEIRKRKLIGAMGDKEYQVFSRGQFIGARLSVITDAEAADMVRTFFGAPTPSRVDEVARKKGWEPRGFTEQE